MLLLLFACPFAGTNNTCYAQKLTGVTPYDTSKALIHSPRKASFYSAVLPGLGQVYNKKYWKVPIIYAGIYALIYSINFNNKYYSKFKKAYIYRIDNDPNTNAEFDYFGQNTSIISSNDNYRLLDFMDYYKRYRDLSILGLAGLYVLNIIDATVDAYLFDYDVSQDLSIKIKPTLINSPNSVNVGLSCSLRF